MVCGTPMATDSRRLKARFNQALVKKALWMKLWEMLCTFQQ